MQNNQKNLTVIIPHYNTPVLLRKLLDTIPENGVQIIVIDDNSDKEVKELLKIQNDYKNKVEFYKNNKLKKGAGTCRNIGLEHAKGEWLLFADADDYFLPELYEKVSKYFDSDYEIVFFTPTSVEMNTGRKALRHKRCADCIKNYIEDPSRKNLLKLKSMPCSPPWSKLIRRKLVVDNNIKFEEVLYSNDIMFSAKIGYYSKKIAATYETIYCVTRRENSLTTHTGMESYDIRLNEYIKMCTFFKDHYNKKDFKYIHATGSGQLFTAIERHYGLKKYFSIILLFIQNKIPIVALETLIPIYWLNRLKVRKEIKKIDQNYYIE